MAQVPNVDVDFDGDGVTAIFDFDFPYQQKSEIFVSVDGVNVPYTWLAGNTHSVQVLPAPALGTKVRIYRSTLAFVPLHVFAAGVPFLPRYVDENNRQMLYVVQEGIDTSNGAVAEAIAATEAARLATLTANDALSKSEQAVATADQAVVTAGQAVVTANDADAKADQAIITSNEAKTQAGEADAKADDAVEKADAAVVTANDAKATAEAIADTADAAFIAAGNAVITADNALNIANAIDAKATQALTNSTTAVADAAEALSTANAIDGKAQTALDDAAAAVVTANAAKTTADAVDGKAQTALDTAATAATTASRAETKADAAVVTASRAETKADAAVVTANEAKLASETNATRIEQVSVIANAVTDTVNLLTPRVTANEVSIAGLLQADTPRLPSFVSPSGNNASLVLVEGDLWMSCGNASVYRNDSVGRGPSGSTGRFGFDAFSRVAIPSTSPVVKAGIVGANAFALLANGELYAWGRNTSGELGLGHSVVTGTPTLSSTGVLDLYTHRSNSGFNADSVHVHIRKSEGVYGAGYNGNGQLGTGDSTNRNVWTLVWATNTPARQVKQFYNLGSHLGCSVLITTANTVHVVGYNANGQLGVGSTATVLNWTDCTTNWGGTTEVAKVTEVTGGFGYADARQYGLGTLVMYAKDAFVRTCGNNTFGTLGNGNVSGQLTIPFNVPLPSPPRDFVYSGDAVGSIFVVGADNNLYSWGYGSEGQLGRGTTTGTPTLVTLPGPVDKLLNRGHSQWGYVYYYAMHVLLQSGVVMTWGPNTYGQQGSGDTSGGPTPRRCLLPVRDADGSVLVPQIMFTTVGTHGTGGPITLGCITKAGFLYGWGHNAQQQLAGQGASDNNEVVPMLFVPPWRRRP